MTNEDMKLPDNKTCGDCAHSFRCTKLFGAQLTNIECDFFPIKFVSKHNDNGTRTCGNSLFNARWVYRTNGS